MKKKNKLLKIIITVSHARPQTLVVREVGSVLEIGLWTKSLRVCEKKAVLI